MANWMLNPVAGQAALNCIVYIFSLDTGGIMKQPSACTHSELLLTGLQKINVVFIDSELMMKF